MHSEINKTVFVLIIALILSGYWIVKLNDENTVLKEVAAGDLWCEIKQNASTTWKQCELVGKDELNRKVARVNF